MARLHAYTIYDSKALTYSPPFFAVAHGAAIRIVQDVANDLNTNIGRHPADFTLLCIGSFDDAAGVVLAADHREHISDILPLVVRSAPSLFDPLAGKSNGAEPPVE